LGSGKYTVPAEVRALWPKGVDCIVKKITGRYYVYERHRVEDPARPGRTKWVSGSIIGKIEGGAFVPKEGYELKQDEAVGDAQDEKGTHIEVGSVTGLIFSMTSRQENTFLMENEVTGLAVRGTYDDELLDDFRSAFKRRSTVYGELTCDRNGNVESIRARSVEIEPMSVPKL